MKKELHSRPTPRGRAFWYTERLWSLAAKLPVKRVRIDEVKEFDLDCWFDGQAPTCREVAENAKRIAAADLSFPGNLSCDGRLMDGGHRIAKAWVAGAEEINAIQFSQDPAPDFYKGEPQA